MTRGLAEPCLAADASSVRCAALRSGFRQQLKAGVRQLSGGFGKSIQTGQCRACTPYLRGVLKKTGRRSRPWGSSGQNISRLTAMAR